MSTGSTFGDAGVWSYLLLLALIFISLLIANIIKQKVAPMRRSLIPVSVLGGLLLLIVSTVCKVVSGDYLFNLPLFTTGVSRTGIETLEILTYHCLAIGFVAMTLRKSSRKNSKGRTAEVFNTGLITVNTYLMQAILGIIITIIASFFLPTLIKCSGLLLAFGFGQGTGQALNYGSIYEGYGFIGGKSFGLTVAALGFLSASLGGVFYLDSQRKKGTLTVREEKSSLNKERIEDEGEIPMVESIDKLTVQLALVAVAYALSFILMRVLGCLVGDGMRSTIFGFNFLFGALMGVVVKAILSLLMKKKIVKRDYINNFLLNRIGGFAFDIMIVAGIGAIQLDLIRDYWLVLILIALVGAFATYFYDHFACFRLFPGYAHEQFLAMFGMLTGTASTGVILLREIDPEFETPASENLVYQNFPAIVFGFPLMLLASFAPKSDTNAYICLAILVAAFIVLNLVLFRSRLRKKK
ncbi:MAG: hypothetical protein K6C09_07250 [Oscillospiraceae bacterium]|nr:hypothetical protein [Oscillospiraceae bacterium]